ncbi:lysine exporter LysO family protein [Psychromonas hadalis]|uniref:lysine exporter LysO family protein n=1 Tax=Psychromonas hadalis TaxID=211669 RepID=UPI0003B5795D|nr:lysine exporter LysO family protein [Psychromonas hadalis]
MIDILSSVFPILFALMLGYLLGKSLPNKLPALASKVLGPLVWLLLLSIGVEFGQIFKDPDAARNIIYTAGVFALFTTLGACLLIYSFCKSSEVQQIDAIEKKKINIMEPIKECVIALSMVFIGVILSLFVIDSNGALHDLPISDTLLYILIFCVGIDIVSVKLSSAWRSPSVLLIPLLVVVGSFGGGAISSLIVGEDLMTSLAISSGFGWFSLSGVLVSSKMGVTYGAIALMTDLFRELFAIILMYMFGHNFAKECVGAGGATSLDSTLPIIKQTCSKDIIPIALVSGLLLSLLAPILITFFLSANH